MIVMASDYVGFRAVQVILDRDYPIEVLVLHSSDRGGFNSRLRELMRKTGGEVLSQQDLKDEQRLSELNSRGLGLGILAWWPQLLRGPILHVPRGGWLNFHPSLLPFNRGKHPNFWSLIDGTPCGVTLHFIDEGVDSGAIVAQREMEVTWEDTGETVYRRSRELMLELFQESLDDIVAGRIRRRPQEPGKGSYHSSQEIDAASTIVLDQTYTARQLLNLIRARTFPPHPSASFVDGEKKYGIQISIKEIPDDDTGWERK